MPSSARRGTLPRARRSSAAGGYVDPDDADGLADSYRFLRRVEHVVQLEDERQTHSVPADRDAPAPGGPRARLPRHAGGRSDRGLRPRARRPPAAGARRARAGVVPAAARVAVRRRPARRGRHRRAPGRLRLRRRRAHAAGRRRAHPWPHPVVADDAAAPAAAARLAVGVARSRPRPARASVGWRRASSARTALATAFRDSPEVARHLALLLGTSRQLGDVLVANPDLIERLPDPSRLRTLEPRDDLVASALSADLVARRTATSASGRCSGGSSATCSAWRPATCSATPTVEQVGRRPHPPGRGDPRGRAPTPSTRSSPFAVVAFGRFGGGELGYASDLDIAFVHDGGRRGRGRAGGERRPAVRRRRHAGRAHLGRRRRPPPRGSQRPAVAQPRGLGGLPRPVGVDLGAPGVPARRAPSPAMPTSGAQLVGAPASRRRASRPLTVDEEREVRRMKVRIEQERIAPGDDPEFHLKLGRGSLVGHRVHGAAAPAPARRASEPSTMVGPGRAGGGAATSRSRRPRCSRRPTASARAPGTARSSWWARGDSLPTRPELVTPIARSLGLHRHRAAGATTAASPGGPGGSWSAASTTRREPGDGP